MINGINSGLGLIISPIGDEEPDASASGLISTIS